MLGKGAGQDWASANEEIVQEVFTEPEGEKRGLTLPDCTKGGKTLLLLNTQQNIKKDEKERKGLSNERMPASKSPYLRATDVGPTIKYVKGT